MFPQTLKKAKFLLLVAFLATVALLRIGWLSNGKCSAGTCNTMPPPASRNHGKRNGDSTASTNTSVVRSSYLEPLPVLDVSIDCARVLADRNAINARDCRANDILLRACPPTARHGRRPLDNFYLSFERQHATHFKEFAKDYREANIAFVHLPKSGGTSVEKVLMDTPSLAYKGRRGGVQLGHCRDFHKAARRGYARSGKAMYYSKRSYGIHHYAYPDRPFAYVTWFRHPVERIVSTFYYLKKHRCFGVHMLCKKLLLPSKSLTDYLKQTEKYSQSLQDIDNYSVRLLIYEEFPEVLTSFEDCCGSTTDHRKIPVIEEKHYLRAKENLEQRMAFVGLLEDWQTSQDMLTLMFNIHSDDQEVHVNGNSHRTQLSDYELNEIERRNHWDLKLYEDALKIYEKQKEVYFKLREQLT